MKRRPINHADIGKINELSKALIGAEPSEFTDHKRNQLADFMARVAKEVRIFMGAKS